MRLKFLSLISGAAAVLAVSPALADKIKHPIAIFAGLDKITGRIISFEVNIDETVQFGSLHVTPRVCYTRPPTEAPNTAGFAEVEEVEKENQFKKIFSGWMFAASPGLSAAEHPVYDVWLTDCKGGSEIIKEVRAVEETPPDAVRPYIAKPETPAAIINERSQRAGRPPADSLQNPQQFPGVQQLPSGQQLPGAQQLPRPGLPLPPGDIPQQRVQEQRRAPSQSFFPTAPSGPPARRDTYYAN